MNDRTSGPRESQAEHPKAEHPTAELILHGGTVYAFDDATPGSAGTPSEAIAVAGGRVLALGTSAEMLELAGPETQVVALNGSTVIPGINDAHLHGAWLGARWPSLFFGGDHAAPTGRLLVTEAHRAAALKRTWALLSSLGITSYTEPGIGPGEDDGETGCFGSSMLDTYAGLAGTPDQTVRVTLLRLFGLLDGPSTLAGFRRGLDTPVPQTDPQWLAIPGVKIFADGIPPMQSAWTSIPYPDGSTGGLMTEPGTDTRAGAGSSVGAPDPDSEDARLHAFTCMIELAHERGLQVAVHATGDRTIEAFIGTVERLSSGSIERLSPGAVERRSSGVIKRPSPGDLNTRPPHYIVHGDLVTRNQIERLRTLGMGIDLQPLIASHTTDWLSERVSPEVARSAWPLDDLLASNVATALTSDAPIATPDWRQTIAAAAELLENRGATLTRQHRARFLQMYTRVPAAQDGASAWKGTLAPGMVADLCVLAADPLDTAPADLPGVDVELTVVGGRIVYTKAGAPTRL